MLLREADHGIQIADIAEGVAEYYRPRPLTELHLQLDGIQPVRWQ